MVTREPFFDIYYFLFEFRFLRHWDFGFHLTFGFCNLSFIPSFIQNHYLTSIAKLDFSFTENLRDILKLRGFADDLPDL